MRMERNSKYFYVFDIETAESIKELTGERYYKFRDRYTGETFYSFRKIKEVIVANKLVNSYKEKLDKKFSCH